MQTTVVRTQDAPVEDRLDWWMHMIRDSIAPVHIFDFPNEFEAGATLLDFGAVQISSVALSPSRSFRGPALIRRSDPEHLQMTLLLQGAMGVTRAARHHTPAQAGEMLANTTSEPYEGWLTGGPDGLARLHILHVPMASLPIPARRLSRLDEAISGDGMASALFTVVRQAVRGAESWSGPDTARLGSVMLDLATAVVAHRLDQLDRQPQQTRRTVLEQRIHTFIERNLGDPELGPRAVAEAHHISLRYLHRIFEEHGNTVAGWIRLRRLERTRRDLLDPALATVPVAAVGARWGFVQPAHFSRAFRAEYGMPPREYRRLQHRPDDPQFGQDAVPRDAD